MWEILLYGGIFLLMIVFIFQLMKLWNAAQGGIGGLLAAIPAAFANALTAVEQGLTNLITSPIAAVLNWFNFIPAFLSLFVGFISNIFGGIFGFGTASLGSVFGSTTVPANVGLGSSAYGFSPNNSVSTFGDSIVTGPAITTISPSSGVASGDFSAAGGM